MSATPNITRTYLAATALVAAAGTANAQLLGQNVVVGFGFDSLNGIANDQNTVVAADDSDAVVLTAGGFSLRVDPFDTGFVVTNVGPEIPIAGSDTNNSDQLRFSQLAFNDPSLGITDVNFTADFNASAEAGFSDDRAFIIFADASVFPAGGVMTINVVTSPGTTVFSAQDGQFFDPATWDLRVPSSVDSASVSNAVTIGQRRPNGVFGFQTSFSDLRIGESADGSLINRAADPIAIDDALQIGLNGFAGLLDSGGVPVRANNITVGVSGPGSIVLDVFNVIDANGPNFPGFFSFRVGANGFPGTITLADRSELISAGGIAFGPGARLNYDGLFSTFNSNLFRTANSTPIVFDASAVIDLLLADVPIETIPGDSIPLASAPGSTVTGTPTVIDPIGYPLTLDTSNPDQLRLTVASIPTTFNWTNPASGNWGTDSNWDTSANPSDTGGFVFVQSGGTANAEGDGPLGLASLALNTLDVGGLTGDGTVNINNIPNITIAREADIGSVDFDERPESGTSTLTGSLSITNADTVRINRVDIGEPRATGTANVTGTGTLVIDNVNTLIIEGDLDAGTSGANDFSPFDGETIPASGTVATGNGNVTLTDIQTVTIGGDLDLADGEANLSNDPGPVTVNQNVAFLAQDISTFTIGSDLDIGVSTGNTGETENVDGEVTFSNVGRLHVQGGLDFMRGGGDAGATGVVNHDMTLNTSDVDLMQIEDDIDMNGNPNIRGSNLLNLRSVWNITRSNVRLEAGDFADIGNIDFGTSNPTPNQLNATGNSISTQVTLDQSTFTTVDETRFGRATQGAPTEGFGTGITLNNGSLGSSGYLRQGAQGEFVFHVDGVVRKAAGDGNPNTYSAWDVPFNPALAAPGAPAVELNGAVTIDFDITPPPGTHTFDFISTTGTIANNASLSVETMGFAGLPGNFREVSFGVVTTSDGRQSLRLVITDCPADLVAPFGVLDLDDVDTFITAFLGGGPAADLVEPIGVLDLADIDAFIASFIAGCP